MWIVKVEFNMSSMFNVEEFKMYLGFYVGIGVGYVIDEIWFVCFFLLFIMKGVK